MKKATAILIFSMFTMASCRNKTEPDPLNISQGTLNDLIGKEVPWQHYAEWGAPETLDGTDNQYWVVYLGKANISFISDKSTQTVIFTGRGKNAAIDYRKDKL